ncbi:hypothetical protein ACLOJK_007448, partial [Asimina triloba]
VHHRNTEFRCSIFPNRPPSDPPPARLRSTNRSHKKIGHDRSSRRQHRLQRPKLDRDVPSQSSMADLPAPSAIVFLGEICLPPPTISALTATTSSRSTTFPLVDIHHPSSGKQQHLPSSPSPVAIQPAFSMEATASPHHAHFHPTDGSRLRRRADPSPPFDLDPDTNAPLIEPTTSSKHAASKLQETRCLWREGGGSEHLKKQREAEKEQRPGVA